MSVFAAILARRSVGKMKPDMPPREKIERILEAAVYAPNHHCSEPWRFFVLAGKAREEIGEIRVKRLVEKLQAEGDLNSEKAQAALAKERGKMLRAPAVIVVASVRPNNPKVLDIENVEATAAAVQNMLLVAQEEGLATMWRTGDPAYDPEMKAFLGLQPEEHIVGFIYVGYPAVPVAYREPRRWDDKTRWMGWES